MSFRLSKCFLQELCSYQVDAETDSASDSTSNLLFIFRSAIQQLTAQVIFHSYFHRFVLKDGSASLTVTFEEHGTGTTSEAKTSFSPKNQVSVALLVTGILSRSKT